MFMSIIMGDRGMITTMTMATDMGMITGMGKDMGMITGMGKDMGMTTDKNMTTDTNMNMKRRKKLIPRS